MEVQPEDLCMGSGCGLPDADSDLGEVQPRRVVRTRFTSDTWRDIEYDVDTGELWFIGEKSHGLDYFSEHENDLWWCYMNTTDPGSGLLEFLMTHDLAADERKAEALDAGWTTYSDTDYSFLTFAPLEAQKTFVNRTAPNESGDTDTTEAYTEDYVEISNEGLFVVLYRNEANAHVYLGFGGAGLSAANQDTLPPGDGSPNRDNGVRTDVAYKTTVELSQESRQALLDQFELVEPLYDDSSSAYDYEHPAGL